MFPFLRRRHKGKKSTQKQNQYSYYNNEFNLFAPARAVRGEPSLSAACGRISDGGGLCRNRSNANGSEAVRHCFKRKGRIATPHVLVLLLQKDNKKSPKDWGTGVDALKTLFYCIGNYCFLGVFFIMTLKSNKLCTMLFFIYYQSVTAVAIVKAAVYTGNSSG